MVTTTLDDELIKSGKELLKQLDTANVFVDAALWFYFSDIENWKLILSLPDLIKQGPKVAYKEVQKALIALGENLALSLDDIAISKPDVPLLQLLKVAIRTGPDISHIRLSKNVINGQLIEDAYIYRLT